jgi:excisionase family DNA binding protein
MPVTDEPRGEGTAAAAEPADAGAGWLSMGAASALLGVSTATLRRWSAEGRIATFTTPGGHRRIRPATIEALLPGLSSRHADISGSATSGQIHRAYHSMQEEGGLPRFLDGVPSGAREPLRSHGRIVAASIMRYLDARADDPREAALAEGLIAAAAYGRIAGALGATMRETVATFLRFRTPFVHQMAEAAQRQGLDAAGATDLLEAVTVAIDRLLDATLEGFESSVAGGVHPGRSTERRSAPAR